jgi:hypothetical protein
MINLVECDMTNNEDNDHQVLYLLDHPSDMRQCIKVDEERFAKRKKMMKTFSLAQSEN